MKNRFNHACENGRSMIEMLGVLAIVGVLSVGGIAGYSKAMSKFKIGKTQDQIQSLVSNIRAMWSSEPDYAGLNAEFLIKTDILPKDMRKGTDAAINAFNGDVAFAGGGAGVKQFTIKYEGLPPNVCIEVATADWGSDTSSGLVSLAIQPNGAGGDTFNWTAAKHFSTLTTVKAQSLCTDPANNFLTWTYQ
jgi:type II secretory pathway pseudopilin PulG